MLVIVHSETQVSLALTRLFIRRRDMDIAYMLLTVRSLSLTQMSFNYFTCKARGVRRPRVRTYPDLPLETSP